MKDPQTLITCVDRDVPNRETAFEWGALRFAVSEPMPKVNKSINTPELIIFSTTL